MPGAQNSTRPCLMAKCTSSALVCTPRVSIIWYLWNSTVRAEMPRLEAISLAERPSARSCSTSRCRGVRDATGSAGWSGPFWIADEDLPRHLRGDVGLPLQGGTDGGDQFVRGRVLQDEAGRPGLERPPREGHVPVHGEEHHRDLVSPLPQLDQRLDAVEVRHGDVGDDDIRPQLRRGRHQLAPVFHHPHQLELRREQALQRFGHQEMVVGQEEPRTARGGHDDLPLTGTQATTVVPCPGSLSMSRVPFTSRTRSRMLARPRLRAEPGWPSAKPTSVIPHREQPAPVQSAQRHACGVGPGVVGHVAQRFLRDAKETERRVPAEVRGHRSISTDERQRISAPDPFAFCPQRLGQAELLQHRGMELIGKGVDVLAEPDESVPDVAHRLRMRLVGCRLFRAARRRWPAPPAAGSRRRAVPARGGRAPPRAPRSVAGRAAPVPPRPASGP